MTRTRVAALDELEPESLTHVEVGGVGVCLARAEDGGVYALHDVCSHEEYQLSAGELWGLAVECPIHGSRFDLRTGQPSSLPATDPVAVYPVTVEDGDVYVEV